MRLYEIRLIQVGVCAAVHEPTKVEAIMKATHIREIAELLGIDEEAQIVKGADEYIARYRRK
jgi:hypothetical protein